MEISFATEIESLRVALDAALLQHGAPARPVKEQPLRFVRKPRTAA